MKGAAAPGSNIEIKDAGAPAAPAPPAERPFHALEGAQHSRRLQIAFDQSHRIRELSAGQTMRGVQDDLRSVE